MFYFPGHPRHHHPALVHDTGPPGGSAVNYCPERPGGWPGKAPHLWALCILLSLGCMICRPIIFQSAKQVEIICDASCSCKSSRRPICGSQFLSQRNSSSSCHLQVWASTGWVCEEVAVNPQQQVHQSGSKGLSQVSFPWPATSLSPRLAIGWTRRSTTGKRKCCWTAGQISIF